MNFTVNKNQRILAFIAAVVVATTQVAYIDENGLEGYGWLFSVIAIVGLLYVGLSNSNKPAAVIPASTTKADPIATIAHAGAKATAQLTAELATQLEKHFKSLSLEPVVLGPGASLSVEAIVPTIGLASVAYLEKSSPALTTEYIFYREMVSKALQGFVAKDLDTWAKSMAIQAGKPNVKVDDISGSMAAGIAATINARLGDLHNTVQKTISLLKKNEPQPLMPLFEAVAVGSKASPAILQQRYEATFTLILQSFQRELESRYTSVPPNNSIDR